MNSTAAIRQYQPDYSTIRPARQSTAVPEGQDSFDSLIRLPPAESGGENPGSPTPIAVAIGYLPPAINLPPDDIAGGDTGTIIGEGEIGADGEPLVPQTGTGTLPAVDPPMTDGIPPAVDAIPPRPDGIPQDANTGGGIESQPPVTIGTEPPWEAPVPGSSDSGVLPMSAEFLASTITNVVAELIDETLNK